MCNGVRMKDDKTEGDNNGGKSGNEKKMLHLDIVGSRQDPIAVLERLFQRCR